MIVLSAVDGAVDYREARPLDGAWWRSLTLRLAAYRNKLMAEALESKTRLLSVAAVMAGSTPVGLELYGEASKLAAAGHGMILPWLDFEDNEKPAKDLRLDGDDAKQRYIAAFGVDPSTPEFKAKEAEMIAKWRAEAKNAKAGLDPLALPRKRNKSDRLKRK